MYPVKKIEYIYIYVNAIPARTVLQLKWLGVVCGVPWTPQFGGLLWIDLNHVSGF